jgi:hypothetical protein
MEETEPSSDVVEDGILCVNPFGTLGAGDQSDAVKVFTETSGPSRLPGTRPPE